MTPHTADDWLLGKTDAHAPGRETHDEPEAGLSETYRPIIGIPLPIAQGAQGPLLLADAVSGLGGRADACACLFNPAVAFSHA